MRRARSLRFRLVAAAVVTAVIGLVVVNVVAVVALRSYLLDQVDSSLAAVPLGPDGGARPPQSSTASTSTSGTAAQTPSHVPAPSGTPSQQFLDNRYFARLDPTTGAVADSVSGPALQGIAAPDLSGISATIAAGGTLPTDVIWLADESGDTEAYRARIVVPPAGSGQTQIMVVAKSLSDVNATVRQVALVDAGVSVLVVLGLIGFGTLLVRVGLRPLDDVEDAAERIAAGDLDARAPHAEDATEVGSLARTFNGMVDAVAGALGERDASERRLRQFLADASHELRTPLTSIRAWAELFRQGAIPASDEALAALARIEADAARMGVLVEDLLLLARLDQHPELRRAPVDLGALVVDVVESLAATAEGHDVRVEAAPGSDVVGDDEALRRVVANLVRNALLHTPDGTHVRVHVQRLVSSVRLDVVDDGQGMTPDVAAQVFERFYRPDSGRSRAVAGSGLGLAIVRSLVEAHGGSVRLQTAPGRGCAFTVELPTALRASDEPTPPGARVEPLVPALDG